MKLEKQTIKTDVLVVGGGLAGCMAAIRASEIVGGAKVLLVEKANVRRSGNAATGVDHTWSYMPEIHQPLGFTPEQLVEDHVDAMGNLQDRDIIYTIAATIQDRLRDMDKWGFPVKTDGRWNYVKKIHRAPTFLHWAGRDQKVLFAKELRERNIRVLNRVMIADLILRDGAVVGAIGAGIREPKFYTILSKSTILTTGGIARLFPPPTSWEFNRATYPPGTGDGVAMAFRAGAELTGMEFLYLHTGPKNFHKKGRGSWIGITEDAFGQPIGRVRHGVDRKKVNVSVESPWDMVRAYEEGGGPVMMNCADTPAEDIAYMRWALTNEGNTALLQYLEERGVDLKENRIEFSFYEPEIRAGISIDIRAAANLPGLFAAGDAIGNIKRSVSPGAFAMGWIAGESAALHARSARFASVGELSRFLKEKYRLYGSFLGRDVGASWKEALAACQDTVAWYGGNVRYERLLRAGLAHMSHVRDEALSTFKAKNPHELMHCLSALNLMDVGECSMLCALERKETRRTFRETFVRVDYPEPNVEMNKLLLIKKEEGRPVYRWREPRPVSLVHR